MSRTHRAWELAGALHKFGEIASLTVPIAAVALVLACATAVNAIAQCISPTALGMESGSALAASVPPSSCLFARGRTHSGLSDHCVFVSHWHILGARTELCSPERAARRFWDLRWLELQRCDGHRAILADPAERADRAHEHQRTGRQQRRESQRRIWLRAELFDRHLAGRSNVAIPAFQCQYSAGAARDSGATRRQQHSDVRVLPSGHRWDDSHLPDSSARKRVWAAATPALATGARWMCW